MQWLVGAVVGVKCQVPGLVPASPVAPSLATPAAPPLLLQAFLSFFAQAQMMRLASQHNLQSVGDSLCTRWRVVEEGEPGAQLVFRCGFCGCDMQLGEVSVCTSTWCLHRGGAWGAARCG